MQPKAQISKDGCVAGLEVLAGLLVLIAFPAYAQESRGQAVRIAPAPATATLEDLEHSANEALKGPASAPMEIGTDAISDTAITIHMQKDGFAAAPLNLGPTPLSLAHPDRKYVEIPERRGSLWPFAVCVLAAILVLGRCAYSLLSRRRSQPRASQSVLNKKRRRRRMKRRSLLRH